MLVPLVGVPWFFLYYCTFRYLIKRFDFATPGREKEALADEATLPQSERAAAVIAGLGGKDNLDDVDCCATRLRVTVKDGSKVNESALKATGARGVIVRGNGVQSSMARTSPLSKRSGRDLIVMKTVLDNLKGKLVVSCRRWKTNRCTARLLCREWRWRQPGRCRGDPRQ